MQGQVFVSYKRDDEARVGRLVRALEASGFDVWWDRGLPGGESWRANIEAALARARCVIVVWSSASTGAAGDFVRDEAAQAKARGILVPVLFDRVRAPLGFGEVQAIDLAHWRGSVRDPFFRDLAATCRAKLEGVAAPRAQGPMARLIRRLTVGGLAGGVSAAAFAFAANVFNVQSHVCAAPIAQPILSDTCGALRIGDRPSRTERLAWSQLPAGDCTALRDFVNRFPAGAYRDDAADLIAARRTTIEQSWRPAQQSLAIYVGRDATYAQTESAARADALRRGAILAARRCRDFSASGLHRFAGATTEAQEWVCERADGGFVCGYDGRAICELEERRDVEREACGPVAP